MKTRQDISTKPYYRCFICSKFRVTCGGRPTRDMDLREWCEYLRDIRDYFRLSNAYITEKAEGSASTTERIMAINTDKDIMRATARRYERAVIGPVVEFTCHLDHDNTAANQIAKLQAELNDAKKEVERLTTDNVRYTKIIDKYLD